MVYLSYVRMGYVSSNVTCHHIGKTPIPTVLPMLPVVIGLAVRSDYYVQRDTSDEIIL